MLSGRLMSCVSATMAPDWIFPLPSPIFGVSGAHGSASSRARRSWTAVCTGDGAWGVSRPLPSARRSLGRLLTGVPTEPFFSYTVSGSRDCPETFVISDEVPATTATTGTVVRIRGMDGAYPSLVPERAVPKLTEMFALYQTHYPDVGISFEGHPLEAAFLAGGAHTRLFWTRSSLTRGEGSPAEAAVLTLIEWNREQPRALLYLLPAWMV